MSNLSDLLPAGAGGKQVDFVASGTIGNGVTVGLKTNGQVEALSSTVYPVSLGGETEINNNTFDKGAYGVYDVGSGKILFFLETNTGYIRGVVGTISGTTISFGTMIYLTSTPYNTGVRAVYAPSAGKVVVAVARPANYGGSICYLLTVSGTSFTVQATQTSGLGQTSYFISMAYANNKLAAVYYGTNGQLVACQLTATSTSITSGADINITNGTSADYNYAAIGHDQDNKVVVLYKDTSSYPAAIALTVSGNGYTVGTVKQLQNATTYQYYFNASYDSVNKKIIGVISDSSNLNHAVAVDSSSGTITNGSFYQISAVASTAKNYLTAAIGFHVPSAKTLVFQYYSTGNQAGIFPLNVSGLTITGDSPTLGIGLGDVPSGIAGAVNSSTSSMGILWRDGNNSDLPTGQVFTPAWTLTNYTSFVGISDAAISSGVSGSVTVKGGIASNVTSLTPNSNYYVQTNGTLSTTTSTVFAGRALSSTSINLDYTT